MEKEEIIIKIFQAGLNELEESAKRFDEYRQFYGMETDIDESRKFLRERIEKDESVIFIAEVEENKIKYTAGFIQLYPIFSSVKLKRYWLLNDLYVMPQFRKLGVGEALLNQAKQFAAETKSAGFFLETHIENNVAQSLYEKSGLKKDEDHLYFYHSTE